MWIDPLKPDQGPVYNPYNKWNTTHGITHLICPPSTLNDQVEVAALSSVVLMTFYTFCLKAYKLLHQLHVDANGILIENGQDLVDCGQHGASNRNSDPAIAQAINALCATSGTVVTCTNPVGLYIQV